MIVNKIIVLFLFFSSNFAFLSPMKRIQILRKGIDHIDDKVSFLIDQRMKISKKIGHLKKQYEVEDLNREEKIKSRIKINYSNLPPELIDGIWQIIFDYSKNIQRKIK